MSGELVLGKLFDLAIGEVLSERVRAVMAARTKAVREALTEDLRTAQINIDEAIERDDVVAMMITLVEALRQGAATRNLRIIGRVLVHKAATPNESTDDFIQLSDAIKSLSHVEIRFLLVFWRCFEETAPDPKSETDPQKPARERAFSELVGPGKLCSDAREFEMIGYALLRTGFLSMISLIGPHNSFRPTPRFAMLVRIAKLDVWAEENLSGPPSHG